MDLFLLSGTRLEGLRLAQATASTRTIATGPYRCPEEAGLRAVVGPPGCVVGGLQHDGFDDLFCTGFGQNILYRNNGTEPFTD